MVALVLSDPLVFSLSGLVDEVPFLIPSTFFLTRIFLTILKQNKNKHFLAFWRFIRQYQKGGNYGSYALISCTPTRHFRPGSKLWNLSDRSNPQLNNWQEKVKNKWPLSFQWNSFEESCQPRLLAEGIFIMYFFVILKFYDENIYPEDTAAKLLSNFILYFFLDQFET